MATKRLTEKGVERIKPPATGRAEIWDTTQSGLLLRVTDKGRKTWNLVYRFGGKKRRMSLGTYPAISLPQARKTAGKALEKVEAGDDPALERKAHRAPALNTVAAAIEEFDKRHLQALKGGKQAKAMLDKALVERYGDTRLDALKRYHVQQILDEIVDRGAPIQANRTLAWIRRFLNWCVERGLLEYNVTAGIKRQAKEQPRDRVLTDAELYAVWTATDDDTFGDLIKLLILTGQRLNEVAKMRWQDVDQDEAVWTLPSESTKAKRVHEVPLSPAALAIIQQRPQLVLNPHVLAGRSNRGPMNGFSKPKARLDQMIAQRAKQNEAAQVEHWTLHDLRRTCATNVARLGFSDEVIGAVLNHAPKGVTARHYQHYRSLPAKREALNAWADRVRAILSGEAEKVVPLHGVS